MVLTPISVISSSSSFLPDSTRIRPFFIPDPTSNGTPIVVFPRPRASSSSVSTPQDNGSPEQFLKTNSIADFMRFKRGGDSPATSQLQTALVSYRKRFPWSLFRPFLQL